MKAIDNVITWLDERTGLKPYLLYVMKHPVPKKSTWAYVFGTAIMTSFVVQVITGICLSAFYIPSAGEAYESIRYITQRAPFGALVRGMHYFGASAMILFIGFHTIRVYLWGSFKYPRELNWLTGVVLLFASVAMGFTGQVLRWDQTAIWTVAVGAEQALRVPFFGPLAVEVFLSGGTTGTATLAHFFSTHVFVLPAVLIATIGLHVYLVLHHGISEPPVPGEPVDPKTYKQKYDDLLKREGRPFWPDAAWRDAVFSTIVVVGIVALAYFVGPPAIEKPPDPSLVNAEPKPDWYLLWYFALLALLPHGIEDAMIILMPLLMVVGLASVPFISNTGERSMWRRPWAIAIVLLVVASIGSLWRAGIKTAWVPNFQAAPIPPEIIGASSGPVYEGGQVFNDKGCLYCHTVGGHGGTRGPDLTFVGDRLTHDQIVVRIVNGGHNMPAYAGNITPQQLSELATFLQSRKAQRNAAARFSTM